MRGKRENFFSRENKFSLSLRAPLSLSRKAINFFNYLSATYTGNRDLQKSSKKNRSSNRPETYIASANIGLQKNRLKRAQRMQTTYPLRNGRFAVRKAPIESNADCIPTPKRKVCGSQNRARRTQTAYPLHNGRFAVHKIALGGCRLHTHSTTEGLRFTKSRSADAA